MTASHRSPPPRAAFAALLAAATVCGCGPADTPSPPVPPHAAADAPEWSLADAEREYVWGLEHGGNLLSAHGFAALREALRAADAAALRALLAADFEGSLPDVPAQVALDAGTVRATRVDGGGRARAAGAEDVVAFLLAERARLGRLTRASLGVVRIAPVDRADPTGPWAVEGRIDLSGRREAGGAEARLFVGLEIAAPSEETLSGPGWLRACHVRRIDRADADAAMFVPVTASIGLSVEGLHDNWTDEPTHNLTGGLYACDWDRDGYCDLLVVDVNPAANRLLSGRAEGGFADVTELVGLGGLRELPPGGGHAVLADLDGDGWVDLLLPHGRLWRNDEGRRFEPHDDASNYRALTGGDSEYQRAVQSVTAADFDNDGLVDLYVHRMPPRPSSWLEETADTTLENQLLRNLGGWWFEDVTAVTHTRGERRTSFTSVWFHANDDRWPDLYVPHEFGDGILYVNREGRRFEARDISPETADFGTMGAVAGDVDGDGHVDLYLAGMFSKAGHRITTNLPDDAYPADIMARFRSLVDGSELYLNHGDLDFSASGRRSAVHDVGWAWGPTLADFDNDGRLDLFAPAGYISRDRTKPDG